MTDSSEEKLIKKGFIGSGYIVSFAMGITAFILAVFALVYLQEDKTGDFTNDRRHQMYVTAWVYIGFMIAGIVLAAMGAAELGRVRKRFISRDFMNLDKTKSAYSSNYMSY